MTEVLVGGSAWWAIPAIALTFGAVFGFFPGFVLRLIILLYPADDPRRRELVAELYVLGRMERIEWVFQQLETALFEGVSTRLARRRSRRAGEQETDPADDAPDNEDLEATKRHDFLRHAAAVSMGAHVLGADPWVSSTMFPTGSA
jgi:hypothetical protein